jgi:hypothetical protein
MEIDNEALQRELDAHDISCELATVFRDELDEVITVLFNPDTGDSYYLARMMKLKVDMLMDTLIEITKKVEEHKRPEPIQTKEEFI